MSLTAKTYHKILLTAHPKTGQHGEHLRNNLHRAIRHSLWQFRHVRFLKTDWQRRLRMPVLPYPIPETECQKIKSGAKTPLFYLPNCANARANQCQPRRALIQIIAEEMADEKKGLLQEPVSQ
jgi:hypothetical protein